MIPRLARILSARFAPSCLLALLLCGVGLPTVAAQNQPYVPPANEGTELFRGLFHFHGITPATQEDLPTFGSERDHIVVIIGTSNSVQVAAAARRTLQNGGAVLIASDTQLSLKQFLPSGGAVEITGQKLWFQTGREQVHVGAVTPVPNLGSQRPEMELISTYPRVEVNEASFLTARKWPDELRTTIAIHPLSVVVNGAPTPASQRLPLTFAAAGVGPDRNPFRCVGLADRDVFSNKMIYGSARQTNPNDNLKFANTLVQWLKGPEGRSKCLFVLNGFVIQKFDEVKYSALPLEMPDAMPPIPDPIAIIKENDDQGKFAEAGNRLVAELQENDRLNRPWTSSVNNRAAFYLICCVIAAIFLYVLLRFRSLGQRFLALFRPIPKDPHRLGPDTAIGSLEHRRLELLRGGDYGGAIRGYVREMFEDRGLPRGYDDPRLPPVEFDVRNPDFLRQSVRTLWAEVCSNKAVTYGRWKELEPMLGAVRAAADDDRWWFTPDEGTA